MNYISRALLFLLIFLSILFSVNSLLLTGLRNITTGDYGVWNKAVKGEINARIIICGSSRALVHFDSNLIAGVTGRSCFNLGLDGTRYDLQNPMLLTYLKYNTKPDLVIQELDITGLGRAESIFNPELFVPYLNEKPVARMLGELDPEFRRDKYIPLASFARFGSGLIGRALQGFIPAKYSPEDLRISGYWPRDIDWGSEFDDFKQSHPGVVTYPIDKIETDSLEGILKEARARGIDIVLVYAPEYYENFALTKNRKEIFAYYGSLAAKYRVPLWDYSGLALNHSTKYFYNSQHLNSRGATIFSKIVAERIRAYLLNR